MVKLLGIKLMGKFIMKRLGCYLLLFEFNLSIIKSEIIRRYILLIWCNVKYRVLMCILYCKNMNYFCKIYI